MTRAAGFPSGWRRTTWAWAPAAEQVHISQSGGSAQIRRLEREFGAELAAAGAVGQAVGEVTGLLTGRFTAQTSDLQQELAGKGRHQHQRASPVDLPMAVTARPHKLTVLHAGPTSRPRLTG
ncbi:LysR family transcriptional regulator [Nonomuraea terrae]|uniref:LysR family transcriptional regulator n=1 Tax=Nonomuraea terrae TaxID=2530383 RepID=UPI00378C2A69